MVQANDGGKTIHFACEVGSHCSGGMKRSFAVAGDKTDEPDPTDDTESESEPEPTDDTDTESEPEPTDDTDTSNGCDVLLQTVWSYQEWCVWDCTAVPTTCEESMVEAAEG